MYKRRLRYIRETNNKKQYDMANILNINPKTYGVYEIESDIIPIKHLNTLANYFNISFDYIFEFSNAKQYPNSSNEININLSKVRLKQLRLDKKLKQEDLANLLNVDQTTISNYENGKSIIATSFLYIICKKYKISADYLLGKIN